MVVCWQVMLGLLPGFGGTQRLPALVGMQNAMPMLMTGSNKKGAQAKKMKLVDLTCDANQLMQVCVLALRLRCASTPAPSLSRAARRRTHLS